MKTKKIKQEDIIVSELLNGKTISSVDAFIDYGMMSLAPTISKVKRKYPNLHIKKYVNTSPNMFGVVIPYAYYYVQNLNMKPIRWPMNTTGFHKFDGESKKDAIIRFMKEFGSINTLQGFTEIYSFRIGAVINRLRNEGYIIKTDRIMVPGRNYKIAQYTLLGTVLD